MRAKFSWKAPFLVDTNVLVYAYDKANPKKQQRALAFLEEAKESGFAFTALQNLCEFTSVSLKRDIKIRKRLPDILKDHTSMFAIIHYGITTLNKATRVVQRHKIPFWDALLAQTAKHNGIYTLVTENEKDFRKIPGITVFNPFKATAKKKPKAETGKGNAKALK